MTNIKNIDAMLFELRLSKSTGNFGTAKVVGCGHARGEKERDGWVLKAGDVL
jgi:hypothetical protein